ncbi:DEAD/DEAH box helicase [Geobacter pelophilus]|uniref:DEAD-box ATP-dependent RNA helicase RhpA n=1 Tax=Geoanaerobacter pelophilus TaxID=60036 RepID=A0AAW4KZT4_9BACT|nr:DEAD/DEAH box helicase [Geoanaerobacter pelophilus]MBT0664093.1 DEAD/DEAH box helicase [Geoanaerobacter pelophilus]
MTFAELNLSPSILKALDNCGYKEPTSIQAEAIPKAMAGHDIIASAQTGTGKTAAFVLPALQRLSSPPVASGKGPRILVLTPTRELANQVTDAVRAYGKLMRVRSGAILGGMPYREQLRMLSAPVDFIVATPGRLIDHLENGRLNLSRLEMLILDEADRMLDMGFVEDVEKIAAATPAGRQTLLFSATLDHRIKKLAGGLLRNPELIQIAPNQITHANIEQRLLVADNLPHKNRLLEHLLAEQDVTKAIVFSATKRDADSLAKDLAALGHKTAALHGDMTQGARNRTITNMHRGQVKVLVATDVAARGLDVTGISHVINFDLPKFAEDYVHRIGRTGRAGASGIAISFVSHNEISYLDRIEKFTGSALPVHVIPGLEPLQALRRLAKGKGAGASRGRSAAGPAKSGARSNASTANTPASSKNKRWGAPRRDQAPVVVYRNKSQKAS